MDQKQVFFGLNLITAKVLCLGPHCSEPDAKHAAGYLYPDARFEFVMPLQWWEETANNPRSILRNDHDNEYYRIAMDTPDDEIVRFVATKQDLTQLR